jgi:2-polyprenyl-3-methyl-5-hydroxy-6-metoxy-1,4-benzoquinol methylase
MSEPTAQEYDDNLMALLEAIWGDGFMSPGGSAEVDRYLAQIDLGGQTVLDIGCGLGGVDLHLVQHHGAAQVTGIDIDPALIERCNQLAQKHGLSQQLQFICVQPGPLEFDEASFKVVTSKDSIIHIEDKHAMARDVYRILEPGGWFAASDWLAGYEKKPSPEMQAYVEAEGLDFGLASQRTYRDALETAGFIEIDVVDRNKWYQQQARVEREQLGGILFNGLVSTVGLEFVEHQIDVWDKVIIALDQGQLRPTHLRGRKPA